MIAKTKIGRSFKGCINYNVSKVEKGLGELLECRGVRNLNRPTMIRDFNSRRNLNLKVSRCVWHTSLSFQDILDNSQILKIAKEWMQGMNLLDTQYVILRHNDTKHHHVHIVAHRVNDDGQTIPDSQNWKRSEALCKVISTKYNLTPLPDRRNEMLIDIAKLKGRDLLKSKINRIAQKVISESKNLQDFSSLMFSKGFKCLVATNPDGSIRGISFEHDGIRIKGSDIHKSLSAKSIVKQIQDRMVKGQSNPQQIKSRPRGLKL